MVARSRIPEGSDPPLPIQLRAWVDGWSERRKLWREGLSHHEPFSRWVYCERHSRLVVIDGYTLDGLYSKFLGLYINDRL
jgi:hypothetical protein